jgi:hypothetical protein
MSDAKAKGKTIQHQDLTTDTATVLVEAEEDWAGLATCEPSGQRCSGMNIGASPRLRRAPWPNRMSTGQRKSRQTRGHEHLNSKTLPPTLPSRRRAWPVASKTPHCRPEELDCAFMRSGC